MSMVWLITGSESGLGSDIAEAPLAAGGNLVAITANKQQLSLELTSFMRIASALLRLSDPTSV
jgi:NAD(P)-dependent dehydrogenase (short-subunit alcohol dehydrogenase family)